VTCGKQRFPTASIQVIPVQAPHIESKIRGDAMDKHRAKTKVDLTVRRQAYS